jgi:hypothetical protein
VRARWCLKQGKVALGNIGEDSNEKILRATQREPEISTKLVRTSGFQGLQRFSAERNITTARRLLVALTARLGGARQGEGKKNGATWAWRRMARE